MNERGREREGERRRERERERVSDLVIIRAFIIRLLSLDAVQHNGKPRTHIHTHLCQ